MEATSTLNLVTARQQRELLPRPYALQPGVLCFDAWYEKTRGYLEGMRDYIERVLSTTSWPHGMIVNIDREGMFDAIFMYVYRTSINRFKHYQIIE